MSLKDGLEAFRNKYNELEATEAGTTEDGFYKEFMAIRKKNLEDKENNRFPALEGAKPCNRKKNRYKDILPYDATRVKLKEVPGVEGSDYINANYIKGVIDSLNYIASQGPLPHTVDDFWRLLWDEMIEVMIMACREYEDGKLKCQRYWPDNVGDSVTFGDIEVTLEDVEKDRNKSIVMRHLVAKRQKEVRKIRQLHFGEWADHGVPSSIGTTLDLIAWAREIDKSKFSPLLIHCSAGCGRTGTICAIDTAWNLLKLQKITPDFNVLDLVLELRQQRPAMVQTLDQYIMVYIAVNQLFENHLNMIKQHFYENVKFDPAGNEIIVTDPIPKAIEGECVRNAKNDKNRPSTGSNVALTMPPKPSLKPDILSPKPVLSSKTNFNGHSDKPQVSPKPQKNPFAAELDKALEKKSITESETKSEKLLSEERLKTRPQPALPKDGVEHTRTMSSEYSYADADCAKDRWLHQDLALPKGKTGSSPKAPPRGKARKSSKNDAYEEVEVKDDIYSQVYKDRKPEPKNTTPNFGVTHHSHDSDDDDPVFSPAPQVPKKNFDPPKGKTLLPSSSTPEGVGNHAKNAKTLGRRFMDKIQLGNLAPGKPETNPATCSSKIQTVEVIHNNSKIFFPQKLFQRVKGPRKQNFKDQYFGPAS